MNNIQPTSVWCMNCLGTDQGRFDDCHETRHTCLKRNYHTGTGCFWSSMPTRTQRTDRFTSSYAVTNSDCVWESDRDAGRCGAWNTRTGAVPRDITVHGRSIKQTTNARTADRYLAERF